jgi:flavin reductase (DIM6/NTAB) family NADH-FMN oxidoreductase RutF
VAPSTARALPIIEKSGCQGAPTCHDIAQIESPGEPAGVRPWRPACETMNTSVESPPTQAALRSALGRFATGVTIITCGQSDGSRVGLTANSFNSLSLEPALVLWSLRLASTNLDAFARAGHFTVNVLADSQVDLSRRFAGRTEDKFAEGLWSAGLHGAPVLAGCAAVFECETVSQQTVGDHALFIGQVLRLGEAPLAPLVFQSGHYHLLGEVL